MKQWNGSSENEQNGMDLQTINTVEYLNKEVHGMFLKNGSTDIEQNLNDSTNNK